jgi:hypothetical protein
MENPHQLAQERLGKVGHGLLTYATALEDAVEKAGVQLFELRSGFDAEIAEFERLLTQAGDADPDELLSASLLTADVGKAYLLLSRAIDRHK